MAITNIYTGTRHRFMYDIIYITYIGTITMANFYTYMLCTLLFAIPICIYIYIKYVGTLFLGVL